LKIENRAHEAAAPGVLKTVDDPSEPIDERRTASHPIRRLLPFTTTLRMLIPA
jgi:hypothetical protein